MRLRHIDRERKSLRDLVMMLLQDRDSADVIVHDQPEFTSTVEHEREDVDVFGG